MREKPLDGLKNSDLGMPAARDQRSSYATPSHAAWHVTARCECADLREARFSFVGARSPPPCDSIRDSNAPAAPACYSLAHRQDRLDSAIGVAVLGCCCASGTVDMPEVSVPDGCQPRAK